MKERLRGLAGSRPRKDQVRYGLRLWREWNMRMAPKSTAPRVVKASDDWNVELAADSGW